MFDSLKYAKILEDAGVPRIQAETHIRLLSSVVGEEMVTKKDLAIVHSDIKAKFAETKSELRTEFQQDLKDIRSEIKQDMNSFKLEVKTSITEAVEKSEYRIVVKLGSLMAGFLTIGLAASQFIFG